MEELPEHIVEGLEMQENVDSDKTTVDRLDYKETGGKKASHLNLLNDKYYFKMFKMCDEHISQLDMKNNNQNVLLTKIILSTYGQLHQSSNSTSTIHTNPVENLAVVKFHVDQNTIVASAFKLTETVGNIKECLANILDLDVHLFSLADIDGNEVDLSLCLKMFGVEAMQKIMFDVRSKTGETGKKIIVQKVNENIPTLTVITVHTCVGGILKEIAVVIEDQCCQKEWLGGFHNRKTNVNYHNAQTQTSPKTREIVKYSKSGNEYLLFHHDTQTQFKLKNIEAETIDNKATQMPRSDLYITSKSDKIIVSKPYVDYEHYWTSHDVKKSVTTIQRAVRRWIRRKRFRSVVVIEQTIQHNAKRQKDEIDKEEEEKERIIVTGAAYPVKRDDFYMLYLMVGNWWKKEWKRINETRSQETKQAEIVALLQKHVQLLTGIEKHKTVGKKESLKKERMRFLNLMAQPITFKNSKGLITSIDDIKTQRAREFKEIYSELVRKTTTKEDRIEVLLVLRNLISAHYMQYEYANDLISLVERELNLLTTGFKMTDLKGLQMRIEQLFVNFLENEECNPKAADYKKPNIPKTISIQIQCYRCKKLLPPSKFPVHVRMKKYTEGGCKSCTWMQNLGNQRVDMSPFVKLLREVQRSEMEKCCHSAVCFIFQPIGMRFLTMNIWHGHSAISGCRDVSKLRHVRWLRDVEWAPWNTALLTNREARCHESVPDVFTFYGRSFVDGVRQKHILAREKLRPLLVIEHDFRSSGVWADVRDESVFLHPSHAKAFAAVNEYDRI